MVFLIHIDVNSCNIGFRAKDRVGFRNARLLRNLEISFCDKSKVEVKFSCMNTMEEYMGMEVCYNVLITSYTLAPIGNQTTFSRLSSRLLGSYRIRCAGSRLSWILHQLQVIRSRHFLRTFVFDSVRDRFEGRCVAVALNTLGLWEAQKARRRSRLSRTVLPLWHLFRTIAQCCTDVNVIPMLYLPNTDTRCEIKCPT